MLQQVLLCAGLCSVLATANAQPFSGQFTSLLSQEVLIQHASGQQHADAAHLSVTMPASLQQSAEAHWPPSLMKQVVRWQKAPFGRHASIVTGWYANGQKALTVTMRQQHLHGNWQSWYSNGQHRDSGRLEHNQPDGMWKLWHANGQLRSVRIYNANKHDMIQLALRQQNPKLTFQPLAVQSLKHPEQLHRHTRANAVLPAMAGEETAPDLPFTAGLPHGVVEDYFANGQPVIVGQYNTGLKEGPWQYFAANGQLSASGYYWQGHRHGAWKVYTENGKLKLLQEYVHGRLVHSKQYHR